MCRGSSHASEARRERECICMPSTCRLDFVRSAGGCSGGSLYACAAVDGASAHTRTQRVCAPWLRSFFWPAREGARHCEGARVWGLCMRLARQKNTQWRMPEPFESHVPCLARGRKTSLNNPAPLLHTLCRVRRRPSGSNGSESPPTRATPCTRVHRCKGGTLAPAQSLGALKQQQVSASLSPRPSSPRDTAKMHSPATTCVHTLRGDAPRAG